MPMVTAMRLAPQAIVLPPRFEAYVAASEQIFDILSSVTPLLEPLSLDEAFLDVTASGTLFGSPATIARHLRERIAREVGLPSSAGIAAVKFVSKIASDFAKPNGQKEVPAAETVSFLAPLPVGRLWGVGPKTESALHTLGLRTVGDIAAAHPDHLDRHISGGRDLWELARGIDPRPVVPDREAKSIGAEDTFEEDLAGREALSPHIHSQALRVGRRLRQAGVKGRVVTLKLKQADFTTMHRQSTLVTPTDDGQEIYRAAMALLDANAPQGKVRLTGVSLNDLGTGERQLSLFQTPNRTGKLNAALDRIADKFGSDAVITADLQDRPFPRRPHKT
jgi:DNA polymerase IV